MTHYMLDLETFSNASDAAIVAIGAVRFDPVSKVVWDNSHKNVRGTFYRVVNAKSSQRMGGRIDADTVMWWLQQDSAAQKALCEGGDLIEVVLKDFSNWVREIPCGGMWGNGSDFDNVILGNAYKRLEKTAPWPHSMNRCYRTVRSFAREVEFVREGTHHNALDDAISQAKHLCKIVEKTGIKI